MGYRHLSFGLWFLFLSLGLATSLSAWETDLDYNYEYEKRPIGKFADWVPFKLHKYEPKFLEDFYEMSNLKQHHGENEIRRNIYFLKIGLAKRFRHPKNALCPIVSEDAYLKYRHLVTMHLHLRIMRSYMRIASLYDKRHLYFHNLDFAHELKNSFGIAHSFYKEAIPHWEKAKFHAEKASDSDTELDLGTMETERYEIMIGKLDFENIIEKHLDRLEGKQKMVAAFLAKYPEADKPGLDQID